MDLKVLALVHDLHLEQYGKDNLRYDLETIGDKSATSCQLTKNAVVKTDDKDIQINKVSVS